MIALLATALAGPVEITPDRFTKGERVRIEDHTTLSMPDLEGENTIFVEVVAGSAPRAKKQVRTFRFLDGSSVLNGQDQRPWSWFPELEGKTLRVQQKGDAELSHSMKGDAADSAAMTMWAIAELPDLRALAGEALTPGATLPMRSDDALRLFGLDHLVRSPTGATTPTEVQVSALDDTTVTLGWSAHLDDTGIEYRYGDPRSVDVAMEMTVDRAHGQVLRVHADPHEVIPPGRLPEPYESRVVRTLRYHW